MERPLMRGGSRSFKRESITFERMRDEAAKREHRERVFGRGS